jgi:hypothetical protein
MADLPDSVFAEVERLSAQGNKYADEGDCEEALAHFQAAWELLPEPRVTWSAGLWLLASIGDMQFELGRFADGRDTLTTAMKFDAEALGNPFMRLRLVATGGTRRTELVFCSNTSEWLTRRKRQTRSGATSWPRAPLLPAPRTASPP